MRTRRNLPLAVVPLTLLVSLFLTVAPALGSVLDVGDSLSVGIEPTLKQIVPSLTIDGQVGRSSSAGVALLAQEYSGQDVVVFDLGTNDDPSQPQSFLADLQRARSIIGNACLVVATINRPPYNGVSYDAINHALESFAVRDGNTQVVPWTLATKLHPEVVGPDGVHVTPYGYQFRAHLFATAISDCGGGTSGPPGGVAPPPRPARAPAPTPPSHPSPPPLAAVVGRVGADAVRLVVGGVDHLVATIERAR